MFDYQVLYKPYARKGHNLKHAVLWLKKSTGASEEVIESVVSSTMQEITNGRKFPLPCPCGCGFEKPYTNAAIDHYMLGQILGFKQTAEEIFIKLIQEKEKERVAAKLKLLSKSDKELLRLKNGAFVDRFKKFVGAPYTSWENEEKTNYGS